MNTDSHPVRGYLLVHQDWYELPDEDDMLRRHAVVTTLNPARFRPGGEARLLKYAYRVLEVTEEMPADFSIGECRSVGEPHYETLEAAGEFLRRRGVDKPRPGFNPVGPSS